MNSYIIEIFYKNSSMDPQARHVRAELLEAGTPTTEAAVSTRRLYKIKGSLSPEMITNVAKTLLVDPVIETWVVHAGGTTSKGKKTSKTKPGFVLDVWPKPGVTDPVGETVLKGLHDLGINEEVHSSFGNRYVFPKIKQSSTIKNLAKRFLANELIHDIHIGKIN